MYTVRKLATETKIFRGLLVQHKKSGSIYVVSMKKAKLCVVCVLLFNNIDMFDGNNA